MSKKLAIGKDGFGLPIELATGSIAILALKGAGKTYTAAVVSEELMDLNVPVWIIDPTGAHWGLKSSATGKSAGYPITIFGGDHADLPLEEGAGEVLAKACVESRFCAILDVSHFRKAAMSRFLLPFLSELYRLNRSPMHLVCDKADLYAPQFVTSDTARIVGAMEDIVRRGRSRGIGTTLITQRPAKLNKDVLTQCECLMALRIGHPKDIKPVMEWVEVQAEADKAEKMTATLPTLPTGTAWIWAPSFGIFEKVEIRRRKTFDSSRTPTIGEAKIEPAVMAKIDLDALGKEIAATVQRAKDNDPARIKADLAKARAEIASLTKSLDIASKVTLPAAVLVLDIGCRELLRFTAQQLELAQKDFKRIQDSVDKLGVKKVREDLTGPPKIVVMPAEPAMTAGFKFGIAEKEEIELRTVARHGPRSELTIEDAAGVKIGACERALLAALAQRHPAASSKSQIAILSGYSVKSSSLDKGLSRLRTGGFMDGSGEQISLTAAGVAATAGVARPRSAEEVRAMWIGQLGLAERTIFEVILKAYPETIAKDEIAAASGYSASSSSFDKALSKLRTLELITRGQEIKATDTFFA